MSKEVKKKTKVKKENKVSFIIVGIVILITLLSAGLIVHNYVSNKDSGKTATEIKVDDIIDEYGYELTDTATVYYKELFSELKTLLATDDFDEEEYASLVAQMFAADFYNLDNKLTNSDIGGVQFVATAYQDNFKLAAQNSIYKTIQSNIYGDRVQELPVVVKASIDSITNTSYSYSGTSDSKAYSVTVSLTYEVDLNYPKTVNLILIHNDKKIEVAKVD